MSLTDGSYNDVCDHYRRDIETIALNARLEGARDYIGTGQIRIGETMEIEFDLQIYSQCTSNGINDCIIFRIGEESNDKYPVIQLGTNGVIKVTMSTINGVQTITSGQNVITQLNVYKRVYVKWSQSSIVVNIDGNNVINNTIDSHKIDTTAYTDDDINLPGVFRLRMYAGDVDLNCADPNTGDMIDIDSEFVFACLKDGINVTRLDCNPDNNFLRKQTWVLNDCPDDPNSAEAIDARIIYKEFPGAENAPHECCLSQPGEIVDGVFKNLCVKTSHAPDWSKDYPTICHIKQNFIAETWTAIKGSDIQDQAPDQQGQMMFVRSGYIEYDAHGATIKTGLNHSINYWPVPTSDFLVEFRKIQNSECGIGTNDETDLCDGLDAAFAQFEIDNSAVDSFTPERERKLIIVSNNKQLTCKNGNNICDEYEDKIYGRDKGENNFGVSVVMVNIDMNGEIDTYLPCLTMYGGNRILDVDTFGNLDFQNTNTEPDGRDEIINHVQHRICAKAITPSPTIDPTVIPTQTPTKIPTKTPTNNPTNKPTFKPTEMPSKLPTDITNNPTPSPIFIPTISPSNKPTKTPSAIPTKTPTNNPTNKPTFKPTEMPSKLPTDITNNPTPSPIFIPTISPSKYPTYTGQTLQPSPYPSINPSNIPTISEYPTILPTNKPTISPTNKPTISPTNKPTISPTNKP
eukprot:470940_1